MSDNLSKDKIRILVRRALLLYGIAWAVFIWGVFIDATDLMTLGIISAYALAPGICYEVAKIKNREKGIWAILGLVFGPFSVISVVILKPKIL